MSWNSPSTDTVWVLNRYDSRGALTFSVAPRSGADDHVDAIGATADANGDVDVTGDP